METGTISAVVADKGYGFIQVGHGYQDVFFHAKSLDDGLQFNDQLLQLRVAFDVVDSERGPRARNVRKAN